MSALRWPRIYVERGTPVVVLFIGGGPRGRTATAPPRNALVVRPGGERIVRPFRGLRKPRGSVDLTPPQQRAMRGRKVGR